MILTGFGDVIAARMRAEHLTLASRWLVRLDALLPGDAREIFSTNSLLDHVPALIVEIGDSLRESADGALAANTAIVDKARELGALRHEQQASLHQVLREYQLLSGVLAEFILEELDRLHLEPPPAEVVKLMSRLHRAVDVLSDATVEAFVTLYTRTIADQRERLEQFTRMAAHEWRQPLDALQFAAGLLNQTGLDAARAARLQGTIMRTVQRLVELTHKLEVVARMREQRDNPVVQEIEATRLAQEAARQLQPLAEAHDVEIRIAEKLPTLIVDTGRLELSLINLLSNAIKYSDPAKPVRFVEVLPKPETDDGWCHLVVRDNGVGIPTEAKEKVFQRFTRAYAARDGQPHVSGLGLGLSIVDDCVRDLGGDVSVESEEGVGTSFTLRLPRRV